MAGYAIINPRPRHRRRRRSASGRFVKAGGKRRRRVTAHRRRRHVLAFANPVRRRRRTHRRHYFHNPGGRAFKFFGVDVGQGLWITAGLLATGIGSNLAANLIPVEQLKTGPGRMAVKAGTVLLLVTALGMMKQKRLAELVGTGGVVSLAIDGYKMAQAAVPGLPALGDYNEVIEGYVPEVSGIGDAGGYVPEVSGVSGMPGMRTPWQQ